MKKTIFALYLLILCSSNLFAQKQTFGLKLGANASSYKVTEDGDSKTGDLVLKFHGGAFIQTTVNKNFSVQVDVLFNATEYNHIDDDIVSINYISVPLVFKYWPITRLNLHVGPQINMLASAKSGSNNVKDSISSVGLDYVFGIEGVISNKLSASMRYCYGITDSDSVLEDLEAKGRNIQLSISFSF